MPLAGKAFTACVLLAWSGRRARESQRLFALTGLSQLYGDRVGHQNLSNNDRPPAMTLKTEPAPQPGRLLFPSDVPLLCGNAGRSSQPPSEACHSSHLYLLNILITLRVMEFHRCAAMDFLGGRTNLFSKKRCVSFRGKNWKSFFTRSFEQDHPKALGRLIFLVPWTRSKISARVYRFSAQTFQTVCTVCKAKPKNL